VAIAEPVEPVVDWGQPERARRVARRAAIPREATPKFRWVEPMEFSLALVLVFFLLSL
jgi:hypothetical protein